jgi:hypothetical protein
MLHRLLGDEVDQRLAQAEDAASVRQYVGTPSTGALEGI